MKISVDMSIDEATQLANTLDIDKVKLLKILENINALGLVDVASSNNYNLDIVSEWFDKISWSTFYFSHLIIIHSEVFSQKDIWGCYLDSRQLSKLAISERSAASRTGGSRRICKSLNSIDILFIKTQNKGKRKLFYVHLKAINDILNIVMEYNDEYREELKLLNIDYPTI